MIISKTPFRISFFGGGTDYPAWYRQHGGGVIGTTIDKFCYVSCRYLPPFFKHRIRVVYSAIELCSTVDEIKHVLKDITPIKKVSFSCCGEGDFVNALRSLKRKEVIVCGIEAHVYLDVPVEHIAPQGRALARHVEDCFGVLDRMVTLGQSGRLAAMSISNAELEAFEQSEGSNLVTNSSPRLDSQS